MNVQGIKLVTGEEVIAEVSVSRDNRLVLKNPVRLQVVPPQVAGASPSMGFAGFPTFSEQKSNKEIEIEPLHVVYTYIPDEQIVLNYNAMFGSGIVTPTKQLII